jgi:hypothetical protein
MRTQLTLIIPGLGGATTDDRIAGGDDLSLRALETLLSRADPRDGRPGPVETQLFTAFGDDAADADLPVAAVTGGVDMGIDPVGWWLRADPVHLHLDRDTLVFAGGDDLQLTDEEAGQLVNELDPVFRPRGWHLSAGAVQRWYLRLPQDPRIITHPPAAAAGRDIRPYLPAGEQAALWHALMNEVQMQLHMSDVNQRRVDRGAPAVNSVWFWGGGYAPRPRASWDHLWCDHVVGRGLARLAGASVQSHPVPRDAHRWLEQAPPGESHLVVLEDLTGSGPVDPQRLRSQAASMNARWMDPLLAALRTGRLERLTLMTGTGTDFTVTPAMCKRWWRRRKRLADVLAAAS